MKSQDVGLLLKLVALERQEPERAFSGVGLTLPDDWRDWAFDEDALVESDDSLGVSETGRAYAPYTIRALADATGISKSQVSLAMERCLDVGLVRNERQTGRPRVNKQALFHFIVYGLPYVFPAKRGEVTRGVATSFGAPVLAERLTSAGDLPLVWPDARGNTKGQSIIPLFKTATHAVRRDADMYAMLALTDAIRVGQPRERQVATDLLSQHLTGQQR